MDEERDILSLLNTEKGIYRKCLPHKFDSFEVGYCAYESSIYSYIIQKQAEFLFKSLFQQYDHNLIMRTLNKTILFLYFLFCTENMEESNMTSKVYKYAFKIFMSMASYLGVI